MRDRFVVPPAVLPVSGLLVAALAACADPAVSIEVLPPRTSVTCAAPGASDNALGRGLLDARATERVHGGYVADLRLVSTGADARVDGVDVRLSRDGDELDRFDDVATGDVFLVGEGDDIRRGVLENVSLVPRSTAVTLADDARVTALDFATLVVEITPRVIGSDVRPVASTFALDVCNGCLVDPPDAEECPGGARQNSVCRVGQDVELFSCVAPAIGVLP
jgi:hypothetical protein